MTFEQKAKALGVPCLIHVPKGKEESGKRALSQFKHDGFKVTKKRSKTYAFSLLLENPEPKQEKTVKTS